MEVEKVTFYVNAWLPKYEIIRGEILFKGDDITHMTTIERIPFGLGVSFQNPSAIREFKLNNPQHDK
jgi:Fe-S cluster assembly ATP-binding protein